MIPFNRPPRPPLLAHHLAEVAASSHHSGDGPMTLSASKQLQKWHPGSAAVLLTTSCTHALELSALLLDVGPGDEVIVPSFTFVSTANAYALRGATLRFADIEEDTLGIDPDSVASLANERTKVIVPVHYAGVGCRIEPLGALAAAAGWAIVEDNAHGLFGSLDGQPLGTFGQLSTLSFHETKNISGGEGGALVVNDAALVERAEIAREKGTNRSQFFRGAVDKYTWVDLGSSWLPSEFVAAAICAGLDDVESSQASRQRVWQRYATDLLAWAKANGVRPPIVPPGRLHPAHLFYLLMPSLADRTRFIVHMRERGVHVVFHYVPLHSAPGAQPWTVDQPPCPITDSVSERLVRLPLFTDMSESDVDQVVDAVIQFECE